MSQFHIAIDGPAGSGKSTISALVAENLQFIHIDTGAMYRAVTLAAIEKNIDLADESAYVFLETTDIKYVNDAIYLDGKVVSNLIRSDQVTSNVSQVSAHPYVRHKMVDIQRNAAKGEKVVMDGRDIGTVVLPNADVKIFLTADVLERAKRRYGEYLRKGRIERMDDVIEEIRVRDHKDSTRKESPLRKADDAIVLDTTYLTIDEVVMKIIDIVKKEHGYGL